MLSKPDSWNQVGSCFEAQMANHMEIKVMLVFVGLSYINQFNHYLRRRNYVVKNATTKRRD